MPDSWFPPDVPAGFAYRDDFITAAEESALLDAIARIEFSAFEMRGVVARRRVAFFGRSYDHGEVPARAMPPFLASLQGRLAAWATVPAEAFVMALINEYRPGAPVGWHRDAPQYGIVAGASLLSTARMKFRPYVRPPSRTVPLSKRVATHEIVLARRSAYLMSGAARYEFEHHVPPVPELRYSITFRTPRQPWR